LTGSVEPMSGRADPVAAWQRSLLHDGFAVLKDAVTAPLLRSASDAVDEVVAFADRSERPVMTELSRPVEQSRREGRYATRQVNWLQPSPIWPRLADLERRLIGLVSEIAQRKCRLSFASLITKFPDAGETPWHQDAAYDRDVKAARPSFSRFTVWLPLGGVDRTSGCLCYLPGSHLGRLRHHAAPEGFYSLKAAVDAAAPGREVCCPLETGDALIHLHHTLHRSTGNQRAEVRHAFSFNFLADARGRRPEEPRMRAEQG
jgi:ectoine hydroxylase-related dioxygenase (phytanoyl-CoA dioxygenase family)